MITFYSDLSIKMFGFYTEKEAKEAFGKIDGNKILSEIVYLTKKPFSLEV
jgi:hypothetical protein